MRHLLSLALCLTAAGSASAESISFGYSWSLSDLTFWGWNPPPSYFVDADGSRLTILQGSGVAVLQLAPPGVATGTPGTKATEIPLGTLTVTRPFWQNPEFGDFGVPFVAHLHLTDPAGGGTVDLPTYRHVSIGRFPDGLLWPYTSGGYERGLTVQLGGHTYAVGVGEEIERLDPAGTPLLLTVKVGIDCAPVAAPEPAALALAATALVLGVACRRRRL